MRPEPYTYHEQVIFTEEVFQKLDDIVETAKEYAQRNLQNSASAVSHPLSTIDSRALIILCEIYESLKPEQMEAEERELLQEVLESSDGKVVRVTAEVDDGNGPITVGEIGILSNDPEGQCIKLQISHGLHEGGEVYDTTVRYNYDDIVSVQTLWSSQWSRHEPA